MKKVFRGLALFAMILLLQLTVSSIKEVYAEQSDVTLTEMNIKIMPEFINPEDWDYELPSLLIGYHGTFTNYSDSAYEGELKVTVPTKLPHFKGALVGRFIGPDVNEPIQEEFTINEEEQTFSWTPKQPIEPNGNYYFVLEYFTGSIEGVTDRSFSFEYAAETDLEFLNLEFYVPFKSEDFQLNKEPDNILESFGLRVFMFENSEVKQDDVFEFLGTYKKDNIVTTMEAIDDMHAPNDDVHAGLFGQDGSEAGGNKPLLGAEDTILIVLALIIVGIFVYIIIRGKKDKTIVSKGKGITPKKIVNKEEEIKKLRKMLADGQIDEKTYKERRAKLG